MELSQIELKALEGAVETKLTDDTRELESLELVLVGGGSGSVVW